MPDEGTVCEVESRLFARSSTADPDKYFDEDRKTMRVWREIGEASVSR